MSDNLNVERAKLLGSLLLFTQYFYKIRTGREFEISQPLGRESHYITVCRELTSVFKLKSPRLIINIPPGHGKSELLKHFVAWSMAHYPDSQFLYISYSDSLATEHTYDIKQIMMLPQYKHLFGVDIRRDSSAKDSFKTLQGGAIKAFGSEGSITGQDGGLPIDDRFSGAIIMDDMHKPDEVFSDTTRERVISNFNGTIKYRKRGDKVPLIFIGQRLHQEDLPGFLLGGKDGYEWKSVILKALDEAGNALHPKKFPKEMLLIEKEVNKFHFNSQFQQNPTEAGGTLFNREDFIALSQEPEIFVTFITADTAETSKDYNDATVFSFWGVYKIKQGKIQTDLFGLHWLDCVETRCEPKDLEAEFMDFYGNCMSYKIKPTLAAIEKKSTGVTLSSILKSMQGLRIMDIERTKASGNKTVRFLEMQKFIASKRITFPAYAKHMEMCIGHMVKITGNNSHRFDDIADTAYDACKIALIDETIPRSVISNSESDMVLKKMMSNINEISQLKQKAFGS